MNVEIDFISLMSGEKHLQLVPGVTVMTFEFGNSPKTWSFDFVFGRTIFVQAGDYSKSHFSKVCTAWNSRCEPVKYSSIYMYVLEFR